MEIRQLKYFAAVADTLNFSRAAETLFISQSALSKQIADLERELGMVLLQRDKRSVRLTPAGKVFLNEAKVILMRMDTIPILLKNTEDLEKKGKRTGLIGVENRVGDSPIFHLGVAEAVHQLEHRENAHHAYLPEDGDQLPAAPDRLGRPGGAAACPRGARHLRHLRGA